MSCFFLQKLAAEVEVASLSNAEESLQETAGSIFGEAEHEHPNAPHNGSERRQSPGARHPARQLQREDPLAAARSVGPEPGLYLSSLHKGHKGYYCS